MMTATCCACEVKNMPMKPRRPCRYPGCPNLCENGVYCEKHAEHNPSRIYDRRRGSATERGYNAEWRVARRSFLSAHPLCVECMKENRLTAATVVDHIIPHRGDMKLFWDESNWQPLCKICHDKKTGSGL